MKTPNSRVMLVNNTDARITSEMTTYLCAFALEGKALPSVYFDCFKVTKFDVSFPDGVAYPVGCTTQTRVIINWA